MNKFADRYEAGRSLAQLLTIYRSNADVIILALPRGGVPVAYEIAQALDAPLDVFVVRKLGVPGHEELAMGAIASGETIVFNDDIVTGLHIPQSEIDKVIQLEQQELERREKVYRGDRQFPDLTGKIVILVDDGIATGATMRAAIEALSKNELKRLIVAVPVTAFQTYEELSKLVDEFVCLLKPPDLFAVGAWYDNFSQTEDEEVFKLLKL